MTGWLKDKAGQGRPGQALTRRLRALSVELNFKEPGRLMSGVQSRLVMVKLMVNGTGVGPTPAAGGREGETQHSLRPELYVRGKGLVPSLCP